MSQPLPQRHHGKSPMWMNACEHACYDENRDYGDSLALAGTTNINFVAQTHKQCMNHCRRRGNSGPFCRRKCNNNNNNDKVSYDAAYVHSGCSITNGAYPGYSNDGSSVYGDAWYCNDGVDVSTLNPSDFDQAYIHTGCDVGVHYSNEAHAWYCKDDGPNGQVDLVYVHPDCSNGAYPEYCNDSSCAFGDGWYCNDSKDVSGWDPNYFDNGFIHPSCDAGVYWDDNHQAWYCNA